MNLNNETKNKVALELTGKIVINPDLAGPILNLLKQLGGDVKNLESLDLSALKSALEALPKSQSSTEKELDFATKVNDHTLIYRRAVPSSGYPKQVDMNTLLSGFEFTYPHAFELKKEGIALRVSGFGSWDPDQEKVQYQLVILGANHKTFTYQSTLKYKNLSGSQITVSFDDTTPFSGVPHDTKCTLSIEVMPIAPALNIIDTELDKLRKFADYQRKISKYEF